MKSDRKRVAVAGLGAIGEKVARWLDTQAEGLDLVGVSARDRQKAEAKLAGFQHPVPLLPLDALAEAADIVVECTPAAVFEDLARSVIGRGKIFVTVSVGALLPRMDLVDLARETGARIVVPTGALLGLDAVRAAAQGKVDRVSLVTRKPPGGLAGAPYLLRHGIELEGLAEPLKVFEGTARAGAEGFPANVNVAAALSLAGIGPDATTLEIWADPGVTRNTHTVIVEAESARLEMTIENVPSPENPRTGLITPLSVIASLRRFADPLQVGT
jgi:aspartate dehydrogenase